ncbi:HNH endonuclease domain-containing protein [[Clostridium] sordellii]|uniref:hypothetical protein n=1 Tax=Paraclostridium sordellii TaxID=1505 RepID=UPI0005E413E8|nr:hypothetical protein [Paeniclostridium sordellii]CEQ00539.1 HNH endonuclease domain-containing protein [[Clostridium] sordellii] [Paeniclostridium sordellii]
MAMLKLCSWSGCTRIVKDNVKYCKQHESKHKVNERERYKEYKRRKAHDEEHKRFESFYNSMAWQRVRELAILDTVAIDVIDYYKLGRITQGERVHHIIELSEDMDKRLYRTNLIYVTERNHRIIHREYNKGNKKEMQELLINLKNRFMSEFKLG